MPIKTYEIWDSCVWVALFSTNDSQHKKALKCFEDNKEGILLTEYVLVEVLNVLGRKVSKHVSDTFIELALQSDSILLHTITQAEFEVLMHFYLQSANKDLSFVDHHLLMLSEKHKLITFDQNLASAACLPH